MKADIHRGTQVAGGSFHDTLVIDVGCVKIVLRGESSTDLCTAEIVDSDGGAISGTIHELWPQLLDEVRSW